MRHRFIVFCAATAAFFDAAGAAATDILSQDEQEYELTVVSDGGETKVVIAPKGDLRSVCSESCVVHMPDGQNVKAGPNDILFIMDGKISLYES